MSRFAHLAQRLFNVPLMITPQKAEVIIAALAERIGVTSIVRLNGDMVAPELMAFDQEDELAARPTTRMNAGYEMIGGVAVIPIEGTLVAKLGTLRPFSGMTGYDGIRQNFMVAMSDPEVKAIMLSIDSPGGEVQGCFDLADQIFECRGEKPIHAILSENACSAAYALGCAADKITVPRTGFTGSIGVIYMHCDISKMLDKAGVKVTMLHYGARKADGAMELPLSEEAQTAFMKDINTVGEMFVETVARNRGIDADSVRETEAATFQGADGLKPGLADAVMAPDAALRALIREIA